jgi:hypothetical protein
MFRSPIAKILIIMLFLKIMLIMDFYDFFIPHFFSLLFDLPPTPAAHRLRTSVLYTDSVVK